MKTAFASHIRNHFPSLYEGKYLVANSSGVDSMALCTLLLQCKISFSIAYANFQLRPAADQEADFLHDWARKNGILLYTQKFDTTALAQQEKKSIQLTARELRYKWFDSLQKEGSYNGILTAHHLNDQMETYIMHSFRGTGPQGLCGIPAQNDLILRPLLPFTKAQIIAFAQKEKIDWCEDKSNATDVYRRNRVRHHVIPALEEEFPNIYPNFQKTLHWMQQQQSFVSHQINLWKERYWQVCDAVIHIDLQALLEHPTPAFWMHQLLAPYGFDAQEVFKLLHAPSGKFLQSATHRLHKERNHISLVAFKKKGMDAAFYLHSWEDFKNKKIPLSYIPKQPIEGKSNQIYLNPERILFPLILRKKAVGDFIYLIGMQGRKKISKYFKDEKYTQLEKESQWLLCQGSEVIWIIGRRANRKFVQPLESPDGVLLTFDT